MRRHSAKRRIVLVLIFLGLIVLAAGGMVISQFARTRARLAHARVSPARA